MKHTRCALVGYSGANLLLKQIDMKENEIKSHTINAQDVRYLKDTISLLNSMVVGGEDHSESSVTRVYESMSILNKRLKDETRI